MTSNLPWNGALSAKVLRIRKAAARRPQGAPTVCRRGRAARLGPSEKPNRRGSLQDREPPDGGWPTECRRSQAQDWGVLAARMDHLPDPLCDSRAVAGLVVNPPRSRQAQAKSLSRMLGVLWHAVC